MKEFSSFNRAWQFALLGSAACLGSVALRALSSLCVFLSSALLSATTAESSGCGEISELVA